MLLFITFIYVINNQIFMPQFTQVNTSHIYYTSSAQNFAATMDRNNTFTLVYPINYYQKPQILIGMSQQYTPLDYYKYLWSVINITQTQTIILFNISKSLNQKYSIGITYLITVFPGIEIGYFQSSFINLTNLSSWNQLQNYVQYIGYRTNRTYFISDNIHYSEFFSSQIGSDGFNIGVYTILNQWNLTHFSVSYHIGSSSRGYLNSVSFSYLIIQRTYYLVTTLYYQIDLFGYNCISGCSKNITNKISISNGTNSQFFFYGTGSAANISPNDTERFFFSKIGYHDTFYFLQNFNISAKQRGLTGFFFANYITCTNNLIIGIDDNGIFCFCNNTQYSYYIQSSNMCQIICPSNMVRSQNQCYDCISLFSLCSYCTNVSCLICIGNASLIANNCTCFHGYYFNSSTKTCSNCDLGCLTCQIFNKCNQCDLRNNFIISITSKQCVCSLNYYLDNNVKTCVRCSLGCVNCTNNQNCISCYPNKNFILENNSCQCPSVFYLDNKTQECLACEFGCLSCSSSTGCIQCDNNKNLILINQNCICRSEYILNNFLCIQCKTLFGEYCISCSNKQCINCKIKDLLYTPTNSGLDSCKQNFFIHYYIYSKGSFVYIKIYYDYNIQQIQYQVPLQSNLMISGCGNNINFTVKQSYIIFQISCLDFDIQIMNQSFIKYQNQILSNNIGNISLSQIMYPEYTYMNFVENLQFNYVSFAYIFIIIGLGFFLSSFQTIIFIGYYSFFQIKKTKNISYILSQMTSFNRFQIISSKLYANMIPLKIQDIYQIYDCNHNFLISSHQIIIMCGMGAIILYLWKLYIIKKANQQSSLISKIIALYWMQFAHQNFYVIYPILNFNIQLQFLSFWSNLDNNNTSNKIFTLIALIILILMVIYPIIGFKIFSRKDTSIIVYRESDPKKFWSKVIFFYRFYRIILYSFVAIFPSNQVIKLYLLLLLNFISLTIQILNYKNNNSKLQWYLKFGDLALFFVFQLLIILIQYKNQSLQSFLIVSCQLILLFIEIYVALNIPIRMFYFIIIYCLNYVQKHTPDNIMEQRYQSSIIKQVEEKDDKIKQKEIIRKSDTNNKILIG